MDHGGLRHGPASVADQPVEDRIAVADALLEAPEPRQLMPMADVHHGLELTASSVARASLPLPAAAQAGVG